MTRTELPLNKPAMAARLHPVKVRSLGPESETITAKHTGPSFPGQVT